MPLRWLAVGASVLALGFSGLFGGLRAVPGLDQVKPNVVNKGVPWNVTVIECRLVGAAGLAPLELEHGGDHWFIVLAVIEVTSEDSRSDIVDSITPKVSHLLTRDPAHVLLARDGSEVLDLNPGMPERIGFVWELSGAVAPPTTAVVQIFGETYRESSLTHNKEWLDREVRAEVTAPVKEIQS